MFTLIMLFSLEYFIALDNKLTIIRSVNSLSKFIKISSSSVSKTIPTFLTLAKSII